MESALRESWNWMSAALSLNEEGLIVTDQEGRVKFLNDSFTELTGWTPEDILGRPMIDVLSLRPDEVTGPVGSSLVRPAHVRVLQAYNCGTLQAKDGRTLAVTLRTTPLLDRKGMLFGLWLMFRPGTDPAGGRAGANAATGRGEEHGACGISHSGEGILVACREPAILSGVRHAILGSRTFRIEAEASNADQLAPELARYPRGFLVIDSSFEEGGDFAIRLKDTHPELHILLLCSAADSVVGVRAVKRGLSCYLTSNSSAELLHALHEVSSGHQYVGPGLMTMASVAGSANPPKPPHEALSDREGLVFRLAVLGKSVKEISGELNLRVSTVSTYKRRIFRKMRMRSTSELVSYAIRHGILR